MSTSTPDLGAFSVSLAVKDLNVSKAFYENMGFSQVAGDGEGYMIMANGAAIIGLFHGMFEGNILTFNPGMSQGAQPISDFTDVRDIRARMVEAGIALTTDTDPDETGPAHIACVDPDGNTIMIDQFFPKPGTASD
ncbi:MAG: VOC family protein [Candidatus Latescibacteria bacterium]|nr:VOC family protein [Candidatus Latescibacterota bacterium]